MVEKAKTDEYYTGVLAVGVRVNQLLGENR